MKKSRARLAVPTALALAAAAVAAAPASAATAPMAAGGSFARTAPFIDGSIYAFECHASAPGALSTTISSCALNSVSAPPSTQPGPVAATSGAVSSNTALTYKVCWTAGATYADGSSQSTSGCSTSSSVAGTGVSSSG